MASEFEHQVEQTKKEVEEFLENLRKGSSEQQKIAQSRKRDVRSPRLNDAIGTEVTVQAEGNYPDPNRRLGSGRK